MKPQPTFKEFLAEIMVDIDPTNPATAAQQARDAARMGPQRAARTQAIKAKAEQDVANQTGDENPDDRQEIALKQRLAVLQQRKAQKQAQQQKQGM